MSRLVATYTYAAGGADCLLYILNAVSRNNPRGCPWMLDVRARQVQLEFLLVALPGALQAVPIPTPKTGEADSAQAPKPRLLCLDAGDLFPPVKEPIGFIKDTA